MTRSLPIKRYLSVAREHAKRVLVLDEHDGSRFVTAFALTELGHQCATVGNVLAAFATIDTFRPEAVVYEWRLHGGAGVGLGAQLRERAARYVTAPAIIVLSTLDEPSDFRTRESIDAYVTKPFQREDLAALLVR